MKESVLLLMRPLNAIVGALIALLVLIMPLYAFDGVERVELRNKLNAFKNRMAIFQDDITQCLPEFREAVEIHKALLRKYPDNEDLQNSLLELVNVLGSIADAFYVEAESIKDSDSVVTANCFEKAEICCEELLALYPGNPDFIERLNSLSYMKGYLRIQQLAKRLQETTGVEETTSVDPALLSLHKLRNTRDAFCRQHKLDAVLIKTIEDAVQSFETRLGALYNNIISCQIIIMPQLINILEAQEAVADFTGSTKHWANLMDMEKELVDRIIILVRRYNDLFDKGVTSFRQKDYISAASIFNNLLISFQNHPYYNAAGARLSEKIKHAIGSFDFYEFKIEVAKEAEKANKEVEIVKQNTSFMAIIQRGDIAFENKDFLEAIDAYTEAHEYAQGKNLVSNTGQALTQCARVAATIRKLDKHDINNYQLAIIYYDAIPYSEWRNQTRARKSTKRNVYVAFSCPVLTTTESFFSSDVHHLINGAGVTLPGNPKLGLIDKINIECIGKFQKMATYYNDIQGDHEVPIFEAVWYLRP